jgi:hypothetical protein
VSRATLFRIASVLFLAASIYHAVAIMLRLGTPWRNGLFCAIDLVFAWFLLKRPLWFVFAFGALTIEALLSHGSHAWLLWHTERRADWLSFFVLVTVPCAFALLVRDAYDRRSGPSHSAQ